MRRSTFTELFCGIPRRRLQSRAVSAETCEPRLVLSATPAPEVATEVASEETADETANAESAEAESEANAAVAAEAAENAQAADTAGEEPADVLDAAIDSLNVEVTSSGVIVTGSVAGGGNLSGLTVTFTGVISGTATTDADGNFTFSYYGAGSGLATAELSGDGTSSSVPYIFFI